MEESINRYGLKRYIPAEIRSKIRKDAGFGCVICGCVLTDYEHIEPEFHEAKDHDPKRMTLLCPACHGRVTRKLIPKKTVWDAKLNPKAMQDGFVHDLLYVNTDEMEVEIGNSTSKKTQIILTIHGKPIVWFEPPRLEGEPSKLCAIFHNDQGEAISYINRNQFIAYSNSQDIRSESTALSIMSAGIPCLQMNREGGSVLHISKMHGRYLDTLVSVGVGGALIVKRPNSTFTLDRIHVENCASAIHIGDPLATLKYRKLFLAFVLAYSPATRGVTDIRGELKGWVLNGEIFNKDYELVGYVRGDNVFNLVNEYIGKVDGSYIVHNDDCYESGEPIFTSQESIDFRNRYPEIGYDVSYRLFK